MQKMTRKISLTINGSKFDVDIDEEFSKFLMYQMAKDFNLDGNIDTKMLLKAYITKNYELYTHENAIADVIEKLEKY